ncbi:MAG: threonine aldolase family protein [Candidatus Nanopelagicaceae bacterium]
MIDLRSDTVTKPSKEMLAAMVSAPVGDDVYGDDPTVNALEERVSAMFGKEAGLFTPTGSLSNQLGIRLLVKPGEELILDQTAHIARAELGAAATFSGITTRTWLSVNGKLIASVPLKLAHPEAGPYLVSTKAIAVENTHNFGGGTVQSIEEIGKLSKGAKELGLSMHLDGARIWNAHIATGTPFPEYGKYFETISVCFSKGLGAPIGSMLLADKELILQARVWRKRYGAGMRQIGLLAAAADYALDNHLKELTKDHDYAKKIAAAIDLPMPETNIVALDLSNYTFNAAEYVKTLKENGILAGALGLNFVRFVTHRDLTEQDIEKTCEVLKRTLVA